MSKKIQPVEIDESKYNKAELDPFVFPSLSVFVGHVASGKSTLLYNLIKLLLDPVIFSAFVAAFIASLFWIATMTKMDITKAYPFMSMAPALVFFVGIFMLNESFTWGKVIGLIFIMIGCLITVKF